MPPRAREDMLKIIDGGGVPIVLVKPHLADTVLDGTVDIEVLRANVETPYIAFSHVWADGRGNLTGNGLLKCQWHWLSERASYSAFWIDTFCVPRGSDDRMWNLQTKAILSMSEIYRNAEAVVVLDSALERAGNASIFEFAMRLKFCSWSRRVWTFHEGAVAQNLLFPKGKDLISHPEMTFQLAQMQTVDFQIRDQEEWHVLARVDEEYFQSLIQPCLMINRFSKSDDSTFTLSWTSLQNRATSYTKDRYLVMGIINQVSKGTLLALQRITGDTGGSVAVQRGKLKLLLLSMPMIPQAMIFTSDERFSELGMQWAPIKLRTEIPYEQITTPMVRRITGKGAIVRCKGWRITSPLQNTAILTSPIAIDLDSEQEDRGRHRISLYPMPKDREATLVSSLGQTTRLAIVLSALPTPANTIHHFKNGLLVEELGTLSDECIQDDQEISEPIRHAKFLALLSVYVPGNSDETSTRYRQTEAKVEWVNQGKEQLWCIG